MAQDFYITTPLYYVNGEPHIGHAYTTILTDVIARYRRLLQKQNVHFLTGLDEHGQKVSDAAAEKNKSPQQHCDDMAVLWRSVWSKLNIEPDDFIRTTEPRHKEVVIDILNKVYEKGDVYQKEYEGWYSVYEERYFTEKDLIDGKDPISGRPVEKRKETNYFFRMSKYQDWLIKLYERNKRAIRPRSRLNEVLGYLKQPLGDLCISRPKSRLEWGIPIPWDDEFVTYVWFDALINYFSATVNPPSGKTVEWPADAHMIAKDILTTHAVYWPIMLHAAGYEPPRQIFAHGWWLDKEAAKMSKSEGNVIKPLDLVDRFGPDIFRYYLMSEMTAGMDANFTIDGFVRRVNADLANDLGNLYNRLAKLYHQFNWAKYKDSRPLNSSFKEDPFEVPEELDNFIKFDELIQHHIDDYEVNFAIGHIMSVVSRLNQHIERWEPWRTAKLKPEETAYAMLEAIDVLDKVAELLTPVMPEKMAMMRQWIADDVRMPVKSEQLFPRIDIKELQLNQPTDRNVRPTEISNRQPTDKNIYPTEIDSQEITIDDFAALDIRVGVVKEAEKVKGSDRLLLLNVDIGSEIRQVVAGIAESYELNDLIGKRVVLLANLKPVKLRGVLSRGMILAAVDGKNIALLTTDQEIRTGSEIS